MEPATLDMARRAKEKVSSLLNGRPELVGIGVVSNPHIGGYAVKVNLSEDLPEGSVPSTLSGVAVFTQIVGQVKYAR